MDAMNDELRAKAQVLTWAANAVAWEFHKSYMVPTEPSPREPTQELSPQAKSKLWNAAVDLLVRLSSTYEDKEHVA
jgi:hypothetical protein